VTDNQRGGNLFGSIAVVAIIISSAAFFIASRKPNDVTVKREPDSASSVTRIETSQFEQVVPFPEPEPVPARTAMENTLQSELAEEIASNSDLVRSRIGQLAKVELACDAAGVCWLSSYIDERHDTWSPEMVNNLVDTLGSYFGECLRKEFGGQWYKVDGHVELRINSERSCFPFEMLRKHIENSPADSILDSFENISGALKASDPSGSNKT
jgi:hypothetical protein